MEKQEQVLLNEFLAYEVFFVNPVQNKMGEKSIVFYAWNIVSTFDNGNTSLFHADECWVEVKECAAAFPILPWQSLEIYIYIWVWLCATFREVYFHF